MTSGKSGVVRGFRSFRNPIQTKERRGRNAQRDIGVVGGRGTEKKLGGRGKNY